MRKGGAAVCHRWVMSAQQHRIYHQLQVTAHLLQKLADRAVRDSGLSTAQLAVLAVVAAGPVSQRTVAERLGLNESGVTAMVRRLEELAVVTRASTDADRRQRLLVLTDEGRRRMAVGARAFAEVNALIDDTLGVQGVGRLAGSLERLQAELRRAESAR